MLYIFDEFKGFYSLEFLQQAYFVIVDEIPKPHFPELRHLGLGDFIDMDVNGITYKNTYYVLPHLASNLLYVYWLSCNYQGEFLSLSFSWYKLFIIGGPLFFSVVHILQHLLWLKNQLPVKMLDDAERIT